MNAWIAVIIAVVGAGGPIVALITRLDRKNDKQHGDNAAMLSRIETKIDTVGDRVTDHFEWHLKDSDK